MVGDSSFTRQKSWSFLSQKKIPHRVSSEHSHFIDGGVEAGRSSSIEIRVRHQQSRSWEPECFYDPGWSSFCLNTETPTRTRQQ